MNEVKFYEFLRKNSHGRIGKNKAALILKTINGSIGKSNWDEFSAMQIRMLLDNFQLIQKQVTELKKEIEKFSDQFENKKYVASVVGVSPYAAAVDLAELGDVTRFATKHQLMPLPALTLQFLSQESTKENKVTGFPSQAPNICESNCTTPPKPL